MNKYIQICHILLVNGHLLRSQYICNMFTELSSIPRLPARAVHCTAVFSVPKVPAKTTVLNTGHHTWSPALPTATSLYSGMLTSGRRPHHARAGPWWGATHTSRCQSLRGRPAQNQCSVPWRSSSRSGWWAFLASAHWTAGSPLQSRMTFYGSAVCGVKSHDQLCFGSLHWDIQLINRSLTVNKYIGINLTNKHITNLGLTSPLATFFVDVQYLLTFAYHYIPFINCGQIIQLKQSHLMLQNSTKGFDKIKS